MHENLFENPAYLTIRRIRCIINHVDAGWSSPEARRAHNPKVAGSNPVPATISPYRSADKDFLFISASNEPSSHACMDIWRLPRGSNTPAACSGVFDFAGNCVL